MDSLEMRVVPDTNVLRTRDEKFSFFSSDFLDAIKPKTGVNKLAVVTEITAKEIIYQKSRIAARNHEKLLGAVSSLEALTGQKFEAELAQDIPKAVAARFEEERLKVGFHFLPTPVEEINWREVITDAVWRRPPFEGNEESKNEKGFRDAIFIQTVLLAAHREPDVTWCVLTNDGLIYDRLKTEKSKGAYPQLEVFRNAEEFLGYVDLRTQKLENTLAAALQDKAHITFYDPDKKTGIFVTAEVENRIVKELGLALLKLPESKLQGELGSMFSAYKPSWVRESAEKIFIEGTRFDKRISLKRLSWITRVRLCALFKQSSSLAGVTYPSHAIRDTRVDVQWSAEVIGEVFGNTTVDGITLASSDSLRDSEFTRYRLGLPLPSRSALAAAFDLGTANPTTNISVPSGSVDFDLSNLLLRPPEPRI